MREQRQPGTRPELPPGTSQRFGAAIQAEGDGNTHSCLEPARRGLLSDETPLRPHVQLEPATLLVSSYTARVRAALACALANAALADWCKTPWVFYSRDHSHYASVRGLAPGWYTRRSVVTAVETLAELGLVEERRTAPSPHAKHRSRFRATPKLLALLGDLRVSDLHWQEPPPIVLRGDNRQLLDPSVALAQSELAELAALAYDVKRQNALLAKFEISVRAPTLSMSPPGLMILGGTTLNPAQRHYYRVFNGDLRHGGRWYGPWWQGMPSAHRPHLTIDGQPIVELDFAACQLRLMFAHVGMPDPLDGKVRHTNSGHDLYQIPGVAREDVKRALLVMINATDRPAARAAIAEYLTAPATTRLHALKLTDLLMARVREHYPALEPMWFTGIGLRMQRLDSDICAAVQAEMRSRHLPVLSIHDSFITWQSAEAVLQAVMQHAFSAAYRAIQSRS